MRGPGAAGEKWGAPGASTAKKRKADAGGRAKAVRTVNIDKDGQ